MIKGHLSDEGAQLTADRTPLPQTLDLIEGLVGRIVQFIRDVAQMSPPPDGTGPPGSHSSLYSRQVSSRTRSSLHRQPLLPDVQTVCVQTIDRPPRT